HGRYLPLGGAMNAGVGTTFLPTIQISLSFFQALEAQTSQGRPLCVPYTRLYFAFAIGIAYTARHGHHTVVAQQIAVERIESGIVQIRSQHALAQIVELMCPIALCGRGGLNPRRCRPVE